jgi:serine protease Do
VVRFKSVLAAAIFGFAGAILGSFSQWPPAAALRAQIADAIAVASDDEGDRQQAYALLDRDAKAFEQGGQLVSVLKRVARLTAPSVVHIEAKKREGAGSGRPRTVEEAGAGILVQRNRAFYVVSNRHVIKDAPKESILIQVEDGRELQPQQIVTDPDTDIAVMSLSAADLTPARIGDSRHVDVGDFVLAMGSPFGLSRSVSLGIISAKGRRELKLGGDTLKYQDFLQTDAAINPGNSGGPLVNLRGEVIALNTAIASTSGINEGIGFGIPINMVMFVARQLIDRGAVRRAKMGVSLDREFNADAARTAGLSRLQGARVTALESGAPAEMAGLQVGDIVLEFDGVPVESDVHLVNLVSITPVGQAVTMVVYRKGRKMQMMCTLVERPSLSLRLTEPAEDHKDIRLAVGGGDVWELSLLGVQVTDLTADLAKQLNFSRNTTGLLIAWVDSGGPLASHVQRGDVIDRIEQQPVQSAQDAQRLLAQLPSMNEVRLHIQPGNVGRGGSRTIVVRPELIYR